MIKRIDLSSQNRKISNTHLRVINSNFPFPERRGYQTRTMNLIMEAFSEGYRYVFLQAPTGFGKSAVAVALSRMYGPAYILVSTKSLQRQYVREKAFKTIEVKGRNNFPCLRNPRWACDRGDCRLGLACSHLPERGEPVKKEFFRRLAKSVKGFLWIRKGRRICSYWEQKCDGMNHRYPVLNYDYFIHEMNFAGDLGRRELVVCDEAHNLEGCLMRFINFSISDMDLRLINCRIPEKKRDMGSWIEEISEWQRLFILEFEASKESSRHATGERARNYIEKLDDLENKIDKLGFLSQELGEDPGNWTVTYEHIKAGRRVTFKPVFVRKWAGNIFNHGRRFLLQSATIIDPDSIAGSLGLNSEECIYLEVPSVFDPARRPLFYRPRISMSWRRINDSLPLLARSVRELMDKYPDTKGVIHTHNYSPIQAYIRRHVKSDRLIFNQGPADRERAFSEFITSLEPRVLVTPSAYEGVDLKHDICRWQLIAKVPYPQLRDEQIRKRMNLDPEWYQWLTILRLVQTYGRGMRDRDDWCDTYIFDTCFGRLFRQNMARFPAWFRESIRTLQ